MRTSWDTGGQLNYGQESHFPEAQLCTFALKTKNKKREVTPQDPSLSASFHIPHKMSHTAN